VRRIVDDAAGLAISHGEIPEGLSKLGFPFGGHASNPAGYAAAAHSTALVIASWLLSSGVGVMLFTFDPISLNGDVRGLAVNKL
jgi:hypothetical protein